MDFVYYCFQVFRKFGVEKFDPVNEQFDPHRHNAVFQIPDGSKAPDLVAAVLKVTKFFVFDSYSSLSAWLDVSYIKSPFIERA